MCRLYGFYATHPTQPSCALRGAQNERIRPPVSHDVSHDASRETSGDGAPSKASAGDGASADREPIDGWGVGMLTRSGIQCRRQVTPTTKNQRTRDDALSGHGTALVTHLRTARIGGASTANTQPFRHRDSLLAHAGTLTAFDRFRGDLLGALPPRRQNAIRGDTDSEHLFQLLLERHRQVPDRSPAGSLRVTLKNLTRWSTAAAPDADLSATLLWVVDGRLAAVRFNRPLYLLERTEPLLCPHCGHPHAYPASRDDYRAVVLASQPVTDEDWQEVPNQSAVSITAGAHATVTSLEDVQPVSWLSG